jgi:3-hydroxyisobutyrate dehydrogenase-like beta-hydroxyacid dehydrogenase
MAKVGYIGLGVMGGRIAKRLLDAGHTVTIFNRTQDKAKPLIAAGAVWAATPKAVAEAADFTFSMVSDTAALREIFEGPSGVLAGLSPGKVFIEMSTVSPAASRELAAKVAAKGAQMLDCPVSGSISTLEAGQVTMMVGGDEPTFKKVEPILLNIGQKATYVGKNGLAVSMKVATNLSVATQIMALSESVLLAEKAGIKRETAIEVLTNSVIGSPLVKYKSPMLINLPEVAWYSVDMMQKDVKLALEMGRDEGVPLPTTETTSKWLKIAQDLNWGEKDFAVLIEVLRRQTGAR